MNKGKGMRKRKLVLTFVAGLCIMQHQKSVAGTLDNNDIQTNKEVITTNIGAFKAGSYIIGPGDIMSLDIFDAPELSQRRLEVLNDGSVTIPLVGSVRVEGMTINKVTENIKKILGKLLLRPEITLTLNTPRPIRIALMGEIEQPGLYTLGKRENLGTQGAPRVSVNGLPTVVDAIQKGGGITARAKLDEVILQRKTPGDNERYQQTKLDLIDLMFNGNQTQNPYLHDGDIIKILRDKNLSDRMMEIATINLSPQTIEVNIIGEVDKPGKLRVSSNTTLSQAILLAGGENKYRINKNDIQLVRINRNGTAFLKRYKLNFGENASYERNPTLRNGDTIRVNRNLYAKAHDVISEATGPISDILTVIGFYRQVDDTFNLKLQENVVLYERETLE